MRNFLSAVLVTMACAFGVQQAQAQVVLPQLDPTLLDTGFQSSIGDPALINFVNLEPFAVDIYWIDYSGDRVFYSTLDVGQSYFQGTFITHPWIAAKVGSGDTLAEGTGLLLNGFLAQTVNFPQDLAFADTAYIGAVPEPASWWLALAGTMAVTALVSARRRKHASAASVA